MATYNIDPAWAGPFNGTEAEPFASFASVPGLVAGDSVLFKRESVHNGQVLYNAARGASSTLASPITFGAYGSGALPVIQSNGWCVDIDSRNGVVVQDLQFRCATGSFSSGGVRALNAGQVTIQRNTIEDTCDYGVRVENTGSSMISTVNVLENIILGTYGNTGILLIWGSAVGGIYEDVRIHGNSVTRAGIRYTADNTNTPYGIRTVTRTTPLTASSGTVDLNLFSLGVQITGNTVTSLPSMGLSIAGISSGGTSTLVNRVSNNTLRDIGQGEYDSHVVWIAGCRDVFVEDNDIDGSIMLRGEVYGTGVGIFIDTFGFVNLFDGSKRIYVRRNKVRNTGQQPENSIGTYEVAGSGILVFLSSDVQITANEVDGCHNGIGVMGWFGTGLKSSNATAKGNRVTNSVRSGIVTVKQADQVALTENYVDGFGVSGVYVEDTGAYAVTNYTETRNGVSGTAATAYQGGSEPTSSAIPAAQRTPAASNLVLPPQWY